jgi:hypothetical protein
VNRGLAIAVLALAGCKADQPSLTDASGVLDTICVGPRADFVLDVNPPTLDATPALGAPDGMAVTLMTNNVITVGFIGLGGVTEASGPDIRIVGDIPAGASATVQIAAQDMKFVRSGDLTMGTPEIDLAAALQVRTALYLRLTGVSGTITIDAVEAVHDTCR